MTSSDSVLSDAANRVNDYRERVLQLEREKEERKKETQRQRRFLELQKDISAAKIEELDRNYQLLRQVNTALEKEILWLHEQLHRCRIAAGLHPRPAPEDAAPSALGP